MFYKKEKPLITSNVTATQIIHIMMTDGCTNSFRQIPLV